ncbi:MAG TPA: Gfo/Idh/MocA family oxidoreductase [Terriglobia bacterium]|nr:Gfo/Idh/MocA family oxidoreductase [Terriglobia bacterium]
MKTNKTELSKKHTRREFLTCSAPTALGIGVGLAATGSWNRVLGANDRIRLGVIGTGVRGQSVLAHFQKNPEVEVSALCDIYDVNLQQAQKQVGNKAKEFLEHRALLDLKEIDAVLIATPDHWHAPIAIDACQAGKDVYVEKPLTYAIAEGEQIIKAARLNDRVVQVGMQQRSGSHYKKAKSEYFDRKKLGKITIARTWWHGNTYHLRRAPFTEKPAGLDWKKFQGQRPWREWDVQQFWNWRAYLDFGGGQITDLFTHWIDVVQWFMNEDLPKSAVAAGGVYQYKDGRTAPDTIHVLLEYPSEWTATFEATLAPGTKGAGIEFVGTEGKLGITRESFTFTPVNGSPVTEKGDDERDQLTADHVRNFLDCVKSRKRPNGDVLIGHRSALASHLGNIAYVEKRRIQLDPIREEILPL